MPHENGIPNAYVFYLLPSLYDQARAIVDFIAARAAPRHPRLAVIYVETDLDRDVVEGLRAQASLHGWKSLQKSAALRMRLARFFPGNPII